MKQLLQKMGLGLLVSALMGCATLEQANQPYERPALPEKRTWSDAATTAEPVALPSAREVIEPEWWRSFGDGTLASLIEEAITNNPDLLMAEARVREAEARWKADKTRVLPALSLGLGTDYQRQLGRYSTAGENLYGLDGRLNWELDIWGKLGKQARASAAGQSANEASWRAVWLKVASTVARSYFRMRRYDEEIQLHRSSIEFASRSLRMYEERFAAGFGTRLEVQSQEAEVSRLQREMMELQHQRRKMENRLATLLGHAAGTRSIPTGDLRSLAVLRRVPLGLPADLISRRPDVIAAEYAVLQSHELVGVARLEKLPSLTIGASAGGSSTSFGNMLDTLTLGLTSGLRLPLFKPSINANIDYRKAQAQRSVYGYKQTVLVAYEEVENALAGLQSRRQQQVLLEEQVNTLEQVAAQRQGQLREGLISQLDLFEAERSRVAAVRARLVNHESLLLDTVTLYESLGGGWSSDYVGRI